MSAPSPGGPDSEVVTTSDAPVEPPCVPGLIDADTFVRLVDKTPIRGAPTLGSGLIAAQFLGVLAVLAAVSAEPAWAVAMAAGLFGSLVLARQAERLDHQHAALQNSQMDKRWIGALCEALERPNRRVRSVAGLLLTVLLPGLSEADAGLLDRSRLHFLYRQLSWHKARWNPDLAIAILRSVSAIGNERALPYVARLASIRGLTPSAKRVRRVARGTLRLLEGRLALEQAAMKQAGADRDRVAAEQVAESVTGPIDPEAERVEAQVREIESEMRRLAAPAMRLPFLVLSWLIIVPYCGIQTISFFRAGSAPLCLLFGALTVLSTQLYRLLITDKHKFLAQRLGEIDDVRSIGRLGEMLDWPDADVRVVVIAALMRLLPRVKASDHVFRSPAQRLALYRALEPAMASAQPELAIRVLKALEQIGDASAIPFVERLSNRQALTARDRHLRDAATDCLPYLYQAAKINSVSRTLLRASAPTAAGSSSLLRAAETASSSDPEELLRAENGTNRVA